MNSNDKDPSQNLSSPYYLHPGENPGLVLVTPPLNGTNYHSWSTGMKRALLFKNKVKFINGDITKPTQNESIFDAWERCNMMVITWITNTLTPQIRQSTIYIDNAQKLWEDLRERFSKGDNFRIYDLLQEVNSIKQGERNITDYFIDLKVLWEELEFLRPIPSCTCNIKCSCHVNKIDTDYRELEYVMCFLKGLGELYTNVRTQILLMEPLPNINKVFSLILHQERQLSGSSCSDVKIHTDSTHQQQRKSHVLENFHSNTWKLHGRVRGKGKGKGRAEQCRSFHKLYHIADGYYSKHRYPLWMKQKNKNAINEIGAENSFNHAIEENDLKHHQIVVNQTNDSLTDEQIQQLLKFLQTSEMKINQISVANGEPCTQQSKKDSESEYIEDNWSN
ncbi:uncharacterized protein LOC108324738 [Vigna angularis]|uniref:uncharacterized protein LOC108324738 n=1 Tax=Phaseolus angularis TaxID=3914 RepID=UPI00080A1668|nr:uncharacterized protein LOC108324738 [Vigna angularis]